MMTFENQYDCPPVEGFLWDKIATSFGDFAGVHEFSLADLLQLRSLIDHQITCLSIATIWYD